MKIKISLKQHNATIAFLIFLILAFLGIGVVAAEYESQTTNYNGSYGNGENTAGTSTPSYYGETLNYGYIGKPDPYTFNGYVRTSYNANNMYNKATNSQVTVGNFQVVTAAPLVNNFNQAGVTTDQYQNNTWYASGSASLGSSIILQVALDPTQDLSTLDIAIKYPRGKIVYAQNFRMDGNVLRSENYGLDHLEIKVADPNVRPQNYAWDKRPIVIPTRMQGQKLILTIVVMDLGSQWDDAMSGAEDIIYGAKV